MKIQRETCPAARFIGKKYTGAPNWDEWWANGWFQRLEALPRLPFNGDAYIGGVHVVNGAPERWIGMLFPADTEVPAEFEYTDIPAMSYAVCALYDREGSGRFYTMETHNMCLSALSAHGFRRKEDDWCLERYACPGFTTPDSQGNVVLDYAISIDN